MPPKSSNKKSGPASWFHCDICNVHITSKDRETHEQVCPIGEGVTMASNKIPLEYIRNELFYTVSLECRTFNVEELKEVSAKHVNNLLFISEGAMRLANFHIGQNVVIERAVDPDGTHPLVRSLWPIPEKFLTSIFLSESDFKLYSKPLKGSVLRIYKVADLQPAKTVRFKMLNDECSDFNEKQNKDIERLLRQEVKQFSYTIGSIVHMDFFNKLLHFVVTYWNTYKEKSIEEALEELALASGKLFQITNGTSVEIEWNHLPGDEDTSTSEHLIKKCDIGGLDKELHLVEEYMILALGLRSIPKGMKLSRGVLLYGPTGCGKTMICKAMSAVALGDRSSNVLVLNVNACKVYSKFLGETEKNLSVYFEKAQRHYPQPTLIIVEDVHTLCPQNELNEMTKRVSLAFMNMLDDLGHTKNAQRTFMLATTPKIELLHPGIRRPGRLDVEVEINAPTPQGRRDILRLLLQKVNHDLTETFIEELANMTHAYVGGDLASLVSTAYMEAYNSENTVLSKPYIQDALTRVKPSAMREVLIECPNVRWADIGGQADTKMKLMQMIEWPLLYAEEFQRFDIKPPRGLLMFGPPGCSKTMIAKALATESHLNFLSIKGPELFSMWVGESERAVREVFRKARQVAPSIVFFDEIEAISGERTDGASGSSVKERVLTQLLTELDGVEELRDVIVVAATNRPDLIDGALLRPGRIDRIVYVGLPDQAARREIFKIKLRSMPLEEGLDIEPLVKRTEGYSGAEIQAVCQEAALKAISEGENFDAQYVEWKHFEFALSVVPPRTSPDLLRLYKDYIKKK